MNTGITTRRTRWLALAAAAILLAVALTAGTLFATNERRQQPEPPTVSQQSVMDATDPVRAVEPPEAPPAPERVFTQPDDNYEEETDLPPIVKTPPRYSNLDSNLNRLVDEASSAQQTRSADGGASATVEPVLVTFYIEPERVAYVREYLETNGVFVRNVGEDYIEAHVLPSMLGAASEQPGILRVDTVIPPRRSQSQNRVISQGVGLHGADAWHNVGYRGDSVKVGVIDGGFERFHQLQQGGELASNVVARCYFADARSPSSRLSDCEKDGDHGTAVAETTLDVAPNATLYVANPFSKGDMQDAARWMATQGVQVINHSVGWLFDGPGDGTSPFSNSPLRTIDSAVASGAMWVNAAGNGARRTWYGTFRNPNRSTTDVQFHHWSSDDIGNSFALREGDSITAFMRWDDSWGTADCDLDLVLWRSFPAIQQILIIDADLRFQNGSQGSVPFAIVSREEVASWQEGIYFLTISKDNPNSCPDDPAWIQLAAWVDYPELQYHSPTHHMGNPEESRNPGFLAVGATHYWNTNAIAPYSNRGPALDGRTKPDITGVACGQSTVYAPDTLDDGTECWFPGTSQAAPHVAGLAALVQQRFPDYRPIQLNHYLRQNAAERGAAGADNIWGHGFATLPDPSSAASAPTTVGTIADMMLTADQMSTVDVSMYFSDADVDMLTYTAGSSDDMIATATVSGSMLTIEGKMDGTATITVYALAGSGMSATQTFDVMVTTGFTAPMIVTTNPVGSGIALVGWDAVAGAAGYSLIATNLSDPSGETRTAAAARDATSGQIQGLTVGDEYLIFVGAFNDQLEFELSAYVRVTAE